MTSTPARMKISDTNAVALSVNHTLIDKPSKTAIEKSSALGWEACRLTLSEFVAHVSAGHAFAPEYKGGHRKGANFVSSGFLAADFDGTATIDEARENAFIHANAACIYTTASHTPERHRFRVVYFLEKSIEDAQDWADANFGLAYRCGSDLSVGDKARCFFGNRKAEFWQLGHTLSSEVVDDLIQAGRELRAARTSGFAVNSSKRVKDSTPLKLADGNLTTLEHVPVGASVHCPYHDDRKASAFVVPSWTKGGIGIHCRACSMTYWCDEVDDYDFNAFDKMAERRLESPLNADEPRAGLEAFFPPDPECVVTSERFLPSIAYKPGVTLVKSPKGTGKTTVLKQLLSDIERGLYPPGLPKKEHPKSILLIGHRRALLREAAGKLGLPYYLDLTGTLTRNPSSLAVCLDSLPNFTESYVYGTDGKRPLFRQDPAYDLVIIDESEQVLSHLIGGTIAKKPGGVERCYDALDFQIRNAKAVIALDADLGMLTTHALRYFRPQDWQSRTRIFYNKPTETTEERVLELFDSETALREELLAAIKRGERCFVTCNSKRTVNVLKEVIDQRLGQGIKMRVITSDNSRDPLEIEFVKNICDEFLKIQVLICSPSLGTGIDITFRDPDQKEPSGLCKVDNVFGFFHAKVNTHTDMDQQLSRVRNPGAIKVWISPARFNYTSNFDVIRDDLARARIVPRAVKGYTNDGLTDYEPNHPLLMIYTHVTAAQRASKNRLVTLFCDLRTSQGYKIIRNQSYVKNEDRKEAERKIWNDHATGLFQSPVLDDQDYLDLSIRHADGEPLSLGDRLTYERNTLQRALGVGLTYDMIKLNYDGGLTERVEVLSQVLRQWSELRSSADLVLSSQELPLARLPKLALQSLLVLIMTKAGIADDSGPVRDQIISSGDLDEFALLCDRNRTILETVLAGAIRADVKPNPVRQLNQFLKLAGLRMDEVQRRKQNGRSVRLYGFDQGKFDIMVQLAMAYRSPATVKQDLEEAMSEAA